jgi:hypothetical protein
MTSELCVDANTLSVNVRSVLVAGAFYVRRSVLFYCSVLSRRSVLCWEQCSKYEECSI